MTIPHKITIKTPLTEEQLASAVASIIESNSKDVSARLVDYFGGDNGEGVRCDAPLKRLMDGYTPGSGRWSDCFCPDIDSAESMDDSYFARLLRRLLHIEGSSVVIQERSESYAFQEEYEYLQHHLAVLVSDD
jgi:hypothetical protein